ncbi:MAG: hypothetical protein Q4E43_04945 [Akkermansia sp.]|nr:hypothetical protein [Akkermansia sp.]
MNTNDIQNSQEILSAESETQEPQIVPERTLPQLQAYFYRCFIFWSILRLYLLAIAIGISSLWMFFKPWHWDEAGPITTCVVITLCLIALAALVQNHLGRRDK